jgi:hypothetical protein
MLLFSKLNDCNASMRLHHILVCDWPCILCLLCCILVIMDTQVQKLEEELVSQRRRAQQDAQDAAAAARAAAQRSAATAVAPAPAPAQPAPAPAPAKQQAKESQEEEQGGNGLLGLTNALGVVVGGGLAGYVAVLNKNKATAEEALQSRLEGEKKAVAALTSEAEQVGTWGMGRMGG